MVLTGGICIRIQSQVSGRERDVECVVSWWGAGATVCWVGKCEAWCE